MIQLRSKIHKVLDLLVELGAISPRESDSGEDFFHRRCTHKTPKKSKRREYFMHLVTRVRPVYSDQFWLSFLPRHPISAPIAQADLPTTLQDVSQLVLVALALTREAQIPTREARADRRSSRCSVFSSSVYSRRP